MAETYLIRMIQRQDTETNWSIANPILEAGEFGYDITNKKIKLGDGVSTWNTLPYFNDELLVSWDNITEKPTIGNGTITIQQNGIQKGIFNVNQTGNTTINLESGSTNPPIISWGDITGKPQIGSGTIYFEDNNGNEIGKVPLNSTEDITINLPIDENTSETWTFTMADGSIIEKQVIVK